MNIADNIKNLRRSKRIEFSAISGYNYYYLPENEQPDGLIYALHAQSDTIVYLIPLGVSDRELHLNDEDWRKMFILKPITSRSFEWPVDLLQCKNADGKYLLYHAFAQRVFLDYVPIKKLLYQRRDSTVLDWRNEQICRVCTSFLNVMKRLDEAEYNYNDFSIERIIFQGSTGDVILRYTPHTRSRSGKGDLDKLVPSNISPEFAPPYLFGEEFEGSLPKQGDYYSIAAIMFRLMIGRLPYEGRGLSNYGYVFDPVRDVEALNHKNYFEHYHKYPHFIFDAQDESNRLAPMQENDLVRERWKCLPMEIKEMFQDSLGECTAEKLLPQKLYSPSQWLDACDNYCWNSSKL